MEVPSIVDFAKCGLHLEDDDIDHESMKVVGRELFQAFSSSGFLYLSNTGVEREKVDELNRVGDLFFKKDLEYKNKYCYDDSVFGYDKLGRIRATVRRPHDHVEGFRAGGASLSDGHAQWPDIPRFETSMKEFAEVCGRLAKRVLRVLGEGMGLKDSEILERSHTYLNKEGNTTSLKINSYPGILRGEEVLPDQARIGEHTDWGTLTFVFQDTVGGLQIKSPNGKYIDVLPIPETVVVNVGDMLHTWSGNKLKSTVHRVIIPNDTELRTRERRSVVYFVNADDKTVLSKLEQRDVDEDVDAPDETNKYEGSITASEYIKNRYRDIHKIHLT